MQHDSQSSSSKSQLVIIGNGMVAGRLLDELLQRDADQYDITVIGEEPYGSYNRIMLSSVLASDMDISSIIQKNHEWYADTGIHFFSGVRVTRIDRHKQVVRCDNSQSIHYDKLVIATGSRAAGISATNASLSNIFLFRTLSDTHQMMARAADAESVIVIGGGLLGLEAAYGLSKTRAKVTLIHRSSWLLNRQLDEAAGTMLKNVMQNMGVDFELNTEVAHFHSDNTGASVGAVTLKNEKMLNADMVVIATGITPNSELGLEAGLHCGKAIIVDDFMQTNDCNISALGECVEHRGETFGLVDPLWRQAQSLAAYLCGAEAIAFENQAIATKLKVSGVNVFSAGENSGCNKDTRSVIIGDDAANIYRKLILRANKICGIVLFGDVSDGPFYFDLMQNGIDVSAALPNLIVGQRFIPTGHYKKLVSELNPGSDCAAA